jgi:two-component system response regulator AtoC
MTEIDPYKIALMETNHLRRDLLKSNILKWGYKPFTFENEISCLDNLALIEPDLVITGNLPVEQTIHFINSLKIINYNLPILFFSGDNYIKDYCHINGLSDIKFTNNSTPPHAIKALITKAIDNSKSENSLGRKPLIIGDSLPMLKLKRLIPIISSSNQNILIQGEVGIGKELVAKSIHEHSDRKGHPFIKVHAISLPYQLLEKELFNKKKYSLLGSTLGKEGLTSITDKSTIFIKEIHAIPLSLQAKLVKFIDDMNHEDTKKRKQTADVQIIASSTKNLLSLVENNLFSKELYYRLNVLPISIPPLRKRISDVPALTDFFLQKYSIELGRSRLKISSSIKAAMGNYDWPENVKELEVLIKNYVLVGNKEFLLIQLSSRERDQSNRVSFIEDYDYPVNGINSIRSYLNNTENLSLKVIKERFKVKTERALIKNALEKTHWNRKNAAKILQVSYKTLLNKIIELNIICG